MKKSVYSRMRDTWKALPVGSTVTRHDMRKFARIVGDDRKKSGLGQYLSKMVFVGCATKLDELRNGLVVYMKNSHPGVKKTPNASASVSQSSPAKPKGSFRRELTALEVGKAVITAIKDLEAKVKEQRAEMREHCSELKEMVEENQRLKTMYSQAQARIIELNKGESLNLDDVRKVSKG